MPSLDPFIAKNSGSSGKEWILSLHCTYTQNIEKNQTVVNATLKATLPAGVGTPYNLYKNDAYYVINGEKTYDTFEIPGGTTVTLGRHSNWVVPHDNEGKGYLPVSFKWYTGLGTTWSPLAIEYKKKNYALPTIPRRTTITATSSIDLKSGAKVDIKLNSKSSAFKHTITIATGKQVLKTFENVTSKTLSYSFSNDDLIKIYKDCLPKAKSGNIQITCTTKQGTKTVGAAHTIKPTVKANTAFCGIPSNAISLTASNLLNIHSSKEIFFWRHSTVDLTAGYIPAHSEIFTKSSGTIGGIITNNDNKLDDTTLASNKIKVIIKDARGYSYSKEFDFKNLISGYSFKSWSEPKISLSEVYRDSNFKDSKGTERCGLGIVYNFTDANGLITLSASNLKVTKVIKNGSEYSNYEVQHELDKKLIKIVDINESSSSETFDESSYSITVKVDDSNITESFNTFTATSKETAIFQYDENEFIFGVPFKASGNLCMSSKYGLCGLHMKNSDIIGIGGLFFNDTMTGEGGGAREGFFAPRSDGWAGAHKLKVADGTVQTFYFYDRLSIQNGTLRINNAIVAPYDQYDSGEKEKWERASKISCPGENDAYNSYMARKNETSYSGTHYFSAEGAWLYGLPRSIPSIEKYFPGL